jgi:hypothetical protein
VLAFDALRALCALELLALDALRTFCSLELLALDPLRTLSALELLALDPLWSFGPLGTFNTLRPLCAAFTAALTGLCAVLSVLAATFGGRRRGQRQRRDTGNQ